MNYIDFLVLVHKFNLQVSDDDINQYIEERVSGYYLADEISRTYRGMMIAIDVGAG